MNSQSLSNGQIKSSDTFGEFANLNFMVRQFVSKLQTSTLVRVDNVYAAGELQPVGFIDATILVNQIDGGGMPTEHVTMFGIPYMRLQGGTDAIIIDPVVGDIGVCLFASRDISKIKSTKARGNPGSLRQFNMSDGMYIGGMLNGTPVQYIRFSADGIDMTSPTAINLTAPDITLDATTVTVNATTVTVNATDITLAAVDTLAMSADNVTLDAIATIAMTALDVTVVSDTLTHNGVNIGYDHVHISGSPGSPTSAPQ